MIFLILGLYFLFGCGAVALVWHCVVLRRHTKEIATLQRVTASDWYMHTPVQEEEES